ncbi:hypothetical protein HELRODRAFT_176045 [Helobdella robusta]|uniref:Fucolectin tachylectin-4 pentraxin-1 domain-containing protein n=1 Tax=Helobdella robusta TaxID=6412 RepID=T1FA28_HELRO|nr:hypothetical protein HELRODRAFT_176045 [Helobdella robusta]ESO00208.1 hypothetical protein HELRODRAFT_176045 [Helobdella robusta]
MMKIYTGWFLFFATQLWVSVEVHPVIELELSNYYVDQKGTFDNFHAGLAIDKNTVTYSIACGNCKPELNDGLGWWMIDLQKSEPISKVVLTSNSKYLQEIKIIVSETNKSLGKDGQLCYHFKNNTLLKTGSVLTFNCNTQPTWGRYLYVVRAENAIFRPDAIAIAEINIFTSVITQ